MTLPGGGLDGLVRTDDGRLMVSSWEAKSLFVGEPAGAFVAALTGVRSPADIGYDGTRNRIMIPIFDEDEVRILPIPRGAAGADEKASTAAAPTPSAPSAGAQKGLRADAPAPETAASKAEPAAQPVKNESRKTPENP